MDLRSLARLALARLDMRRESIVQPGEFDQRISCALGAQFAERKQPVSFLAVRGRKIGAVAARLVGVAVHHGLLHRCSRRKISQSGSK